MYFLEKMNIFVRYRKINEKDIPAFISILL
ncbi:hypothetical protein DEU39_4485 [Chryseobacterium sp. AG363]|nr:hypothetical protein DEU39_4485 [Chryseobacterium sp. AG363]